MQNIIEGKIATGSITAGTSVIQMVVVRATGNMGLVSLLNSFLMNQEMVELYRGIADGG